MRSSLRASFVVLLGLGTLSACTVNYYVPAATDAPMASNPPRRMPPRGRWEPAPRPRTSYPPRQYPPVAQAPGPSYPAPSSPAPAPGPVRQTPTPASPPAYPTGGVKPIKQPATPPPVPAPTHNPAPVPTYPYPTGGVKPVKETAMPAPASTPAPAPTLPYQTGGIKPSKELAPPASPALGHGGVKPQKESGDPVPATGAEIPFETGGIKPSKESVNGPTQVAVTETPAEMGGIKSGKEVQAATTEPAMVFGRTPCLGRCPHFTARIFADGRVQYEGFRYAPVEGQREVRLSPETVRNLLQAADQIGFRQLSTTYGSGASDMPSTALTITYPDGTRKSVRAEDNVPAELQKLFTLINAQVEKALGVSAEK
ncbi:DUF6438 domain-containing protein [Hymenobacter swuensis]|uniref:DUF6438 domain-containing protein n=1 Tax=Hymenobacter swuensis DY53 TaxID=1227739 RepID=W8EXY6_9BACT|nr:DUF6438 domain-containing protein [Hymenobacter swuensis]AHJ96637.1 hypothetical protein Hsw_1042 [Hymenobacter swuensis DY53]